MPVDRPALGDSRGRQAPGRPQKCPDGKGQGLGLELLAASGSMRSTRVSACLLPCLQQSPGFVHNWTRKKVRTVC